MIHAEHLRQEATVVSIVQRSLTIRNRDAFDSPLVGRLLPVPLHVHRGHEGEPSGDLGVRWLDAALVPAGERIASPCGKAGCVPFSGFGNVKTLWLRGPPLRLFPLSPPLGQGSFRLVGASLRFSGDSLRLLDDSARSGEPSSRLNVDTLRLDDQASRLAGRPSGLDGAASCRCGSSLLALAWRRGIRHALGRSRSLPEAARRCGRRLGPLWARQFREMP